MASVRFVFESEHLSGAVDFKGNHFPKSAILYAVFFYVRYGVSYRDLEEIMAECGVEIDLPTLNCRVVKFSPQMPRPERGRAALPRKMGRSRITGWP